MNKRQMMMQRRERASAKELKMATLILSLVTIHSFLEFSSLEYVYLTVTIVVGLCTTSKRSLVLLIGANFVGLGLLLEVSTLVIRMKNNEPHIVVVSIVRGMYICMMIIILRTILSAYDLYRCLEHDRLIDV